MFSYIPAKALFYAAFVEGCHVSYAFGGRGIDHQIFFQQRVNGWAGGQDVACSIWIGGIKPEHLRDRFRGKVDRGNIEHTESGVGQGIQVEIVAHPSEKDSLAGVKFPRLPDTPNQITNGACMREVPSGTETVERNMNDEIEGNRCQRCETNWLGRPAQCQREYGTDA